MITLLESEHGYPRSRNFSPPEIRAFTRREDQMQQGDLNDAFKRSSLNGWRHDGLPWEQM